MTVKELLSILESIPYGILTYANSDYEFHGMSHGIEIRFEYDKCVQAMKNTKAYLEILGFKTI